MENIEKLGRVLANIRQVYIQWAKEYEVSYTTFAILYSVYCHEQYTQKEVCEVWNLAKQTVSNQCNELMDQGLLNIVQNDANRRQKILSLTERGRAFARPFSEGMRRAETQAFAALGEETGGRLIEGAERFYAVFEQEVAQALRAVGGIVGD